MKSLRLVLVSPLPPPVSGIGRWTEVVLRELAKVDGVEITLVDTAVRWRGVHQLEWWRRAIGGGMQSMRDTWRTWRALRRARPQAMHLCTSAQISLFRDIAMLSLARMAGVRSHYHLHFGRVPDISRRKTIEWRLLRLAAGLASVVIPIDADSEAALARVLPAGRVVRLPNCLDLAALEAERDASWVDDRQLGVTRVVFVGHVKEAKGALDLATAARRIANDCVLELEFVGPVDAECRARIEATAAGEPLRVVFRDSRSHAWAMESVRRAHVLALPSHTEGFPNVVMEAMALGIPVLGTRVGAIAEMLDADGSFPCGLVVAPRDTVALAASLGRLLADRALAQRMGAAGRMRFVANYSSSAVVGRLLGLWKGTEADCAAKSQPSVAPAGATVEHDCTPPCG